MSGKNLQRPQFLTLLKILRKDDILITDSYSRISRNMKDLLKLIEDFQDRGVILISLKEDFNLSSSTGKLMVHMLAVLSQYEFDLLKERQMEGIKLAKLQGKYKGRQRVPIPPNFNEYAHKYFTYTKENPYKLKEFMSDTNLTKSTLLKHFRIFKKQKKEEKTLERQQIRQIEKIQEIN